MTDRSFIVSPRRDYAAVYVLTCLVVIVAACAFLYGREVFQFARSLPSQFEAWTAARAAAQIQDAPQRMPSAFSLADSLANADGLAMICSLAAMIAFVWFWKIVCAVAK